MTSMRKRIILILVALMAVVGITIAVYYFRLTAPVEVSSTPPAASTLAPGAAPPGETTGASLLYRIDPERSQASYTVDETFFDVRGLVTVTGTTNAVSGEVLVNRNHLPASQIGEIVVDISQLRTDEPDRDNAIRRGWLESATYPLATFKNATISDMPPTWQEGEPFSFKMTGDMTVRDVTRQVTWDVTATLDGDILSGKAVTQMKMSDFGVTPPDLVGMLRVEDDITLTLDFVATDVTSGASVTPTAPRSCVPIGWGPTRTEPIDEAPVRSKVGEGHVLTGFVRSSDGCAPIAGAKIIFWLANPAGEYDDDHRATLFTDASGAYRFESNFPGIYDGQPPHIHFYASAEGYKPAEQQYSPKAGQSEGSFDIVLAPDR